MQAPPKSSAGQQADSGAIHLELGAVAARNQDLQNPLRGTADLLSRYADNLDKLNLRGVIGFRNARAGDYAETGRVRVLPRLTMVASRAVNARSRSAVACWYRRATATSL